MLVGKTSSFNMNSNYIIGHGQCAVVIYISANSKQPLRQLVVIPLNGTHLDNPNIYYILNIFILVSGASPGNWSKDTFSHFAQIDICPLHPLICELSIVRVFQPVSSSRLKIAYSTRNLVSACLVSRLDLVVLGHSFLHYCNHRYCHGHL